jgi:hypothetical protein
MGSKLADQTDGSHCGLSLGCKEDVQEVPTVVLEFSPGLFGLYEVWHFHDAVLLLPVGLDVFCKLLPKTSTELSSENGLTVLPENPKTW